MAGVSREEPPALRIVEHFPRAIREIEHVFVPTRDGTRLAARLWLPEGAEAGPVPAILEYHPYGKREGTRERDERMHRYFAGHGHAAVRVDVRGSGDSEGLLADEYDELELRDGEDVIAWIAAQPWCDGTVGMIGKSWGGFNALQIAARRPPALRGVVSVCASDDRYADDAHYMGGCLLLENFHWGQALFTLVAQPPDPELLGPAWRDLWRARLEAARPFAVRWLRHPLRDAYWRRGSVCEDYGRIACPVFAVGGWSDAYSNAVPRLVAGLGARCRGLVGPWAHQYPHEALPRPSIGFLQETLRFFEGVLGPGGGVPHEPAYRAWMTDAPLARGHAEARGGWVAEDGWPSPHVAPRRLALGAKGLGDGGSGERARRWRSPQDTGLAAGAWCAFGPAGLPGDQREDDARSLCFDSAPLERPLAILGAPVVEIELAVDRPTAFLAARLCEVAPDGASARVSYGLRNLAHDEDHGRIVPLSPGRRQRVRLVLNDVAHVFAAGRRLRVALSTSYWPLAWPSPEPVELVVFAGSGALTLPVREPRPGDAALRPFGPAEGAPGPEVVDLDDARSGRTVTRDPAGGGLSIAVHLDQDAAGRPALSRVEPIDLEVGYGVDVRHTIHPDDPLAARSEIEHATALRRPGWEVRTTTRTRVSADRRHFRVEAELRAHEDGREVFTRRFDERVPRKGR